MGFRDVVSKAARTRAHLHANTVAVSLLVGVFRGRSRFGRISVPS